MTDKPHGVEVLGQKMVLFRESSGKVRKFTLDLEILAQATTGGIYRKTSLHSLAS